MHRNDELVARAVAAIPPWRAFLDEKEAEFKAQFAQMRAGPDQPEPPSEDLSPGDDDDPASLAARLGLDLEAAGDDPGDAATAPPAGGRSARVTLLGRDELRAAVGAAVGETRAETGRATEGTAAERET